jgi:hypothetical protein
MFTLPTSVSCSAPSSVGVVAAGRTLMCQQPATHRAVAQYLNMKYHCVRSGDVVCTVYAARQEGWQVVVGCVGRVGA